MDILLRPYCTSECILYSDSYVPKVMWYPLLHQSPLPCILLIHPQTVEVIFQNSPTWKKVPHYQIEIFCNPPAIWDPACLYHRSMCTFHSDYCFSCKCTGVDSFTLHKSLLWFEMYWETVFWWGISVYWLCLNNIYTFFFFMVYSKWTFFMWCKMLGYV